MAFKSRVWQRIAAVLAALNLGAMGFAMGSSEPRHAMVHALLTAGFGIWAWRLRPHSAIADPGGLQDQVNQQAAALDEAQAALADQSAQLVELQERLDFAERIMAQIRDRPALGKRDDPGP